jgi:hypothetical protein
VSFSLQMSTDDPRQAELDTAIQHSLQHHQFKAGTLLQQARKEKLFGVYGTFKDWAWGTFRLYEQDAYRLLNADAIATILKKHACPEPVNERQIRSLSLLKIKILKKKVLDEEKIVLAWERACQHTQKNRPTYQDVDREVRRLLPRKPDEETDNNYRIYRNLIEKISTNYKRALMMVLGGKLEQWLALSDKKSCRQQAQLAAKMIKLSDALAHGSKMFKEASEECDDAHAGPNPSSVLSDTPARNNQAG